MFGRPSFAYSTIFNFHYNLHVPSLSNMISFLGLLLAAFAMCLVLWRARKDANVRRYGYQKGKSESNFAWNVILLILYSTAFISLFLSLIPFPYPEFDFII